MTKFMGLLHYFPYLKEGKEKLKKFMSGLPQNYRDKMEFANAKTMEETIR